MNEKAKVAEMLLDGVLEYLNSPDRWTRGSFARDSLDEPIYYRDAKATCWCLHGAIMRVVSEKLPIGEGRTAAEVYLSYHIREAAEELLGKKVDTITTFNDNHTYEEVLSVLRATKEKLKGLAA